MTNLVEAKMVDGDEIAGNNARRVLWVMVAGFGIIMTGGAIAGFLAAMNSQNNDPLSAAGMAVLTVFIGIILGLAYSIWRNVQKMKLSSDPLSRREKLNNRILIGCGIFGGLVALLLSISGDFSAQNPNAFSNDPISPTIAIILAVAIGVLLPILSWYWHARVVDEQEEAAYRTGALFAIYAFWFVAPSWWLLWRGGILPAPDGAALYMMTTFIALIVWFWKKYR